MTVGSLVPVSEYLNTSYRPDCDYVDGELRERNLGEFEHSSTQRNIIMWLVVNYPGVAERVLPEQRVQVRADRYRIPDVCITNVAAPAERITKTPPALCIEILSREDRMSDILDRIDDYFQMGVPVCWIVDPFRQRGWIATPGQLSEPVDRILLAGEIAMPVAAVMPRI
jgi:Uma2 family endonuclease